MKYSAITRIRREASQLQGLVDSDIKQRHLELKYRAMTGESMQRLIVPAFGLVVEACRRTIGQVQYDVQLECGRQLLAGHICEMKTGEGKTLTASLVAATWALFGRGMHVITFNDYLATRDCQTLLPAYELLGLSVGIVDAGSEEPERRAAYRRDITYGSAKELGFDFLRDRIRLSSGEGKSNCVMRGLHFALVDEADSILIDEAKTPLIIGMTDQSEAQARRHCFDWAASHAIQFEYQNHFRIDPVTKRIELTVEGIKLCRSLPQNDGTRQMSMNELYQFINNAIKVNREFELDKTHAIINDEIVIIDEFTGRPAEGRQWQQGIHQAVQAKEGVSITPATRSAATITIQTLFKRYRMFCGMTGTGWTSRRELRKVYEKQVVRIPTHRPTIRIQLPTQVFVDQESKFEAVADTVNKMIAAGRAVLVGTRSVLKSEQLASRLERLGIPFDVLNAKFLDREAAIVSGAGRPGQVTIATNMAGRGTDIKLDPAVKAAGGLHVILTEIHESERIDWQLIGRGSRQGDPGSFQIFVSLDDEILKTGLGEKRAIQVQQKHSRANRNRLRSLFSLFRKAQQRTERKNLTDRLIVMQNDHEKKKAMFETGEDPYLNRVQN